MKNRIIAAVGILAGVTILGLLAWGYVLTNQRDAARAGWEGEKLAHQSTVANHRRAQAEAERADAENRARVEAEQRAANERISDAYEARIAAARADYERLLRERARAGNSGAGSAPVPARGGAAERPDGAAPAVGFPAQDGAMTLEDALIASEQALQLEALQAYVRDVLRIVNSQPEN